MLLVRYWWLALLTSALLWGAPHYRIVFTQAPSESRQLQPPYNHSSTTFLDRARIVLRDQDGGLRILTSSFHSAADPEISFDGKRILFSAKRNSTDNWDIFEMEIDGSAPRQITQDMGNCRNPIYQSAIFYLNDPSPSYQISFVSDAGGELNGEGVMPSANLYSVMPDGSALRRLTHNLSNNLNPVMASDGRILFAALYRKLAESSAPVQTRLFGINLDGTDHELATETRSRIQNMPSPTPDGLIVFVEAEQPSWDGAGTLGSVTIRRPMHSYRQITAPSDGLFHSPSPLPGGKLLTAWRPGDGSGTHGIYQLDPSSGKTELIFDDPDWHELQPHFLAPRAEPDGRSSVVDDGVSTTVMYCLSVYDSDLNPEWLPRGNAKRLRVLEGLPRTDPGGIERRRFLGEINIAEDGSFHLEVPAKTPIQLQMLDSDGLALRSTPWIWSMNNEKRGCIGCHEDPERAPENVQASALLKPAIQLTLPPDRRRYVDFKRDVQPIIAGSCTSSSCHSGSAGPPLDETGITSYIHSGQARTSPLIWSILARNTAQPWDDISAPTSAQPMPPPGAAPLTEDQKRTIIEWIDLGAVTKTVLGVEP